MLRQFTTERGGLFIRLRCRATPQSVQGGRREHHTEGSTHVDSRSCQGRDIRAEGRPREVPQPPSAWRSHAGVRQKCLCLLRPRSAAGRGSSTEVKVWTAPATLEAFSCRHD